MPFLQNLASLFSSSSTSSSSQQSSSRKSAINSTFDAFSLPTTSAGKRYAEGPDLSGLDSASSSPGPSRRGSASYTSYPPPKDAFQPALAYFPPLSHTFHRLRTALADSFPELLETLNTPCDPGLLSTFEAELGCPLPPPVRQAFLIADGQDIDATSNISGSGGLFYGLHLLPLEEVMREWAFWRHAEHDPASGRNPAVLATMASVPPQWIKSLYACRGWIPLLSDMSGNYVGVDLDPGPGGAWGQVIVFGRDFDRKCVLWRGEGEGGWGRWLASFVDELESGEGWEAEKSNNNNNNNSSDEEEDVGFGSYNSGGTYGEGGKGLRLAGEYRGWNVLEAWWDKSVRRWEEMGLGLDVEEVERGLKEARRLAGLESEGGKGKGKERDGANGEGSSGAGLGIGMRTGERASQVEIPVLASPNIPAPSTPVPHDSDVLLPPSSPENPPLPAVPKMQQLPRIHAPQPQPSPVRVITPITSASDHPLKPRPPIPATRQSADGYLSPPSRSPPRSSNHHHQPPRKSTLPPAPLDLPTRADVQAMAAIARAEVSGLRGGWVMNLDTSAGSAARRAGGGRQSEDAEMVDIDLEGGKLERFGSPRMSSEDMAAQRDLEKLALSGVEHRRASPNLLQGSRSPSPAGSLSDVTPKAPSRPISGTVVPQSVIDATSALRMPPRVITDDAGGGLRGLGDRDRDREVVRGGGGRGRMTRESSVVSQDSADGLLEGASSSRVLGSPVQSPTVLMTDRMGDGNYEGAALSRDETIKASSGSGRGRGAGGGGVDGREGDGVEAELDEAMEEISLDGPGGTAARQVSVEG